MASTIPVYLLLEISWTLLSRQVLAKSHDLVNSVIKVSTIPIIISTRLENEPKSQLYRNWFQNSLHKSKPSNRWQIAV